MLTAAIKDFLDGHHAKYVTITHSPAYTAQEIAASAHIPGKELAKTVMVKLDGDLAIVALPADRKLDLERLKKASHAKFARLATEEEFAGMFPGCEVGAMPPLGELYGLDVYVAQELTRDREIAFNAGSHTELIKLRYDEFRRLARPHVANVCVEH